MFSETIPARDSRPEAAEMSARLGSEQGRLP